MPDLVPVISLRGVSYSYVLGPGWARRTIEAAHDVDISVSPGETVGLVGESGSGKSTIGRIALGRLSPQQGTVLFQGIPFPHRRTSIKGQLAAVLQHPSWSLDPRMRVGESVAEPLDIMGATERGQRDGRVADILAGVGLDRSYMRRFPHELSGGQRQRVSIARALVTTPVLVVFDEAVSALDVSVQAQVLNLIKDLQSTYQFAALFISHDLAAVRYVSHRVAVVQAARVVEVGLARTFYEEAHHPYSRYLLAATNLKSGKNQPGSAAPGRIAEGGLNQ